MDRLFEWFTRMNVGRAICRLMVFQAAILILSNCYYGNLRMLIRFTIVILIQVMISAVMCFFERSARFVRDVLRYDYRTALSRDTSTAASMIILRLIRMLLTSSRRFKGIMFSLTRTRRFNFRREDNNRAPTNANEYLILS